jgi:hypothetical protein
MSKKLITMYILNVTITVSKWRKLYTEKLMEWLGFWFVFVSYRVRMSIKTPNLVTEIFHKSRNVNAWIIPLISLGSFPSKSLSVHYSSTVLQFDATQTSIFRPIVPAPDDYDDGEFGEITIGRGNRSTQKKPAPVSVCPRQIPQDLTGREPRPQRWEGRD